MNDMETNQENNRVAETPPTEPVTAGQVLILTGDPGDKATAILSDGQEMTLATIRDGTAQAAFMVPRGCGRVRLDCADRTRCSIMSASASFSAALFGSSAGGGEISPVQPGLNYQSALPDDGMLQPDTVYDLGTLTAAAYLSNLWLNYSDRIVSCELWMDFGSSVPAVTFPASWVWIGGLPDISAPNTACRIVIRREPSRTVANLAYSA